MAEKEDREYEGIVTNFSHPVLVIAGPGAGKTYLLGDRVKRLLERGVDKDSITVLTFGKDASLNMKARLLDKEGGFGLQFKEIPTISTMHSLGLEIVNRSLRTFNLRKENLRVLEEDSIKALLYRDATLNLTLDRVAGNEAYNCKIKGDCKINPDKRECQICKRYWQLMALCNYIDFDDQVLFACQLLETNPGLLEEYQNRAQHLLIDEYQDINAAQYRLIELLSRKSHNGLFAVGDDAQSIYSFRGGSPEFILRFEKDFPEATIMPLNHSRRCHKNIIKDANIALKNYYTDWSGPFELNFHVPLGEEPKIIEVKSDKAEAKLVASISREALSEKKSVLVLVPKKSFFKQLSYTLRSYGVPHLCPNNLLPDWVSERLQSIDSVINWVKDPEDNFKTRIAIETLSTSGGTKIPGGTNVSQCKPETLEKRLNFDTEVSLLWGRVDKGTCLWKVLQDASELSDELKKIRSALNNLIDSCHEFKGPHEGDFAKFLALSTGAWITPEHLIEDLCSLSEILRYTPQNGPNVVQIMTMRKAKGLEADVVIMVGLEDDIIPNPKSLLEEEARLFYVSMTRAKEKLYLIHSFQRPRNISYGPDIIRKNRTRFIDSLGRRSEYNPI